MAEPTLAIDRPVVHLTFDGVLQPIGASQVAKPVLELAGRGIPHVVVSLERPADLADVGRVESLEQRFCAAGVKWVRGTYRSGSRRFLQNTAALARLSFEATGESGLSAIHARSFLCGPAAIAIRARTGAPILYDIRGFWIDNRLEASRALRNPLILWAARWLESRIYARSAAVVSLTELGLDVIRSGRFGAWRTDQLGMCIPTCADYDAFTLRGAGRADSLPADVRAALEGKLVVGFVGSVNGDYCVPAMLRLFRHVVSRRPNAVLLCLTEQSASLRALADREGVSPDAMIVRRAPHEEMPAWLARIDWGLLLLVDRFAKWASMPTKLAEFFASGIRPIAFGCNAELRHWVERAGSGHVLPDLSEASLRRAAAVVASSKRDPNLLEAARQRTRPHFDLVAGVDRYESVLRTIIAPQSPNTRATPARWFRADGK
jgi:glycosyltransferase involved in cell wall biosynthesis